MHMNISRNAQPRVSTVPGPLLCRYLVWGHVSKTTMSKLQSSVVFLESPPKLPSAFRFIALFDFPRLAAWSRVDLATPTPGGEAMVESTCANPAGCMAKGGPPKKCAVYLCCLPCL